MSEHLNWRYSTQKFDPAKEISSKDLSEILEALWLAPSSFGLQPWKFIVIKDKDLRQKLRQCAWGQSQVTDASHLIVLCAFKSIDEDYVRNYITKIAQDRSLALESLKGYQDSMIRFIKGHTPESLFVWMEKQVHVALGMFLMECAYRKIDACPMGGFESEKVDEVLGLEKQGLESVALCPIGYRSPDDKYASFKKVRFPKEDILIDMQ